MYRPGLLLIALASGVLASETQVPFVQPLQQQQPSDSTAFSAKELNGRFLHVTDLHPDAYYLPDTAESNACHRPRNKKTDKNIAGPFGLPYSECDSPLSLTNYTLDHIGKKWTKNIDFVIWTGDNVRHDNDRKLPRTQDEIYALNRAVAKRMDELFLSQGIPVVPSLGNNDIWPHNILTPGPNGITNEFSNIWHKFIPFHQLQVFQRGAYYSVEVIPNSLAVVSLNTLYFYDNNKAVEGCPYLDPLDPGNLELDWLDVQLELYRSRGMKVYLTGHVPPSPGNYWPQCYTRYVDLALRFQDTIVGHLYGHMNDDFFFFLDSEDLEIPKKVESEGHKGLFNALMTDFGNLSKKSNRYAVVNVSPSVVPNPYIPTFRIFSYNSTGQATDVVNSIGRNHGHKKGGGDKEKRCREDEYKDTWKCHLKNSTWHNSEQGSPSRNNELFTPLGYAQYHLPGLDYIRKRRSLKYKLEYLTYQLELLHPLNANDTAFVYPVPIQELPKSLRAPMNATTTSKFAPYGLKDLTIPSWLGLGRRLGDEGEKKLRKKFKSFMRVKKKGKKSKSK
ncbi:endopolyphosphatase [Flagelloscypha sp. PMI_526]|nr:endopolyphosphatase [Flagelloscypha sp. PMI_526]